MVHLNLAHGTGYCEYAGLSTDTKPTEGINTGSKFVEVDTGDEYLFDSESVEWILRQSGGGGGGDATSNKVGTGKVGSMKI